MEIAEKDAALWEYFVANTEGFINSNIQKSLGLANGTGIKYHSIVPQDEEQSKIIENHLNNTPFGTVLYLEEPPYAVNVEIVNVNKNKWKTFSICTNKTVIPILQNRSYSKWKKRQIMGGENYQPSRVEVRPLFPLEPGIAITIHKAQGRTIQKVILSLSRRKIDNINPEYAALYVVMSRVRYKEDIRLFLHQFF